MIDKRVTTAADAVAGIGDGATLMVSGFQEAGAPRALLAAVLETGVRGLTLVTVGTGSVGSGVYALIEARRVVKVISSSGRGRGQALTPFEEQWTAGKIELELVPQGSFVERIRAGGAGFPAYYTPVGVGTKLAEGKETRMFDGREYVMETALKADMTILRADRGDRWGNLRFRGSQGNFGHVMSMAGKVTVAEVREIVADGDIAPDDVHTPGIFINRVVQLPDMR
ncbi:MAG: 3-oxoacid CoA-transferase subunit A [Proteobacteria bacterium]|nr:3-oxoacid CoA-transferase subunit A [Pseudomonadota bacterium]